MAEREPIERSAKCKSAPTVGRDLGAARRGSLVEDLPAARREDVRRMELEEVLETTRVGGALADGVLRAWASGDLACGDYGGLPAPLMDALAASDPTAVLDAVGGRNITRVPNAPKRPKHPYRQSALPDILADREQRQEAHRAYIDQENTFELARQALLDNEGGPGNPAWNQSFLQGRGLYLVWCCEHGRDPDTHEILDHKLRGMGAKLHFVATHGGELPREGGGKLYKFALTQANHRVAKYRQAPLIAHTTLDSGGVSVVR